MADTVQVNLATPVWDENKRLYRAGKGREIPKALAEKLGLKAQAGDAKEELPAISKLADHIAEMDEAQVRALLERDDRTTAKPVYEKRLAELKPA